MSMLRAVWDEYYNYGSQEEMQARYQDRLNYYNTQKSIYEDKVAQIEEKYRIPLQNIKTEYEQTESRYRNRADVNSNINLIWSWTKSNDAAFVSTKLGVEGLWNTYLGGLRPIDGSYGLRIRIKGRLKATATTAAEVIEDEMIFSSDEFYGNPYAYYTTYSQQIVYDISRFQEVQSIQVYFWQDHNFLDETGAYIPYQQETEDGRLIDVNPNIKIKGLRVLLGMDAEEIADETVFLYTYDPLEFGRNAVNQQVTNDKKLNFCWVHQVNGEWILVNSRDQLFTYGAELYWYHQKYNAIQNGANPPDTWAGINYEILEGPVQNITKTVSLNPDQAYERYRVAVTWDNRHITSDTLEFSNVDHTLSEQVVGDNELILRILEKQWYTEDGMSGPVLEENGTGYQILPHDGREDFFVYDENNRVIKDKYNRNYSEIEYYIQVWIRNNLESTYVPLQVLDTDDPTFDVVWSFPEQYTMLDHFDTINGEDKQSESLIPNLVTDGSWRDQAIGVTAKTTRKFRIKDTWNLQYTNNTISADVTYRGKVYHVSKSMTFGESGSDGSEFTVSIHQGSPSTLGLTPSQKFVLFATVHDSSGARVESAGFVFTWQLLSPTLITKTAGEALPSSWQNSDWNYDNTTIYGNYVGACISGYIRDPDNQYDISYGAPPIFKVTVNNAATYAISAQKAFMLVKSKPTDADPYSFSLPSRVEFKSDGTAPICMAGPFLRWTGTRELVYSYPDWDLRQFKRSTDNTWYEQSPVEKLRLIGQTTTSKQIDNNDDYSLAPYLDTINTTLNTVSIDWMSSDSECAINYLTLDADQTYGSFSEQLTYANNSARRLYFKSSQSNEDEVTFNQRLADVKKVQDAVNKCVSRYVKAYTTYTLDPYLNSQEELQDSWFWVEGMDVNYYTWIGYTTDLGYVRQAITFVRNVYSSSLVNSWDSTLTLDQEHNAVLTRMVSAGSKDAENRFTGVMLGDWIDYGNSSIDIVGLYGFNAGVQMFGFKADGTGFIGKAGKGQIQFDGNYALISNYDHSCYINLDPILYASDGEVRDSTFTGYSPYFLYMKTPRSSPINSTIEELEERVFWSKEYIQDTAHDYFLVDPNNGVLMTGGIVSTYGKIGNWMISDNGLYQKHETGDLATSHYMYLGYNTYPDDPTLAQAVTQENLRFQNKIDEIKGYSTSKEQRATSLWEIIQEVGQYFPAIFTLDPVHYMNYGWGFQWASDYLKQCLKEVGSSASDADYRNWIWDETNLRKYFVSQERVEFIKHSHYNQDGTLSGTGYQTGGYYTARPLLCLTRQNTAYNVTRVTSAPTVSIETTYYGHSVRNMYHTLWDGYSNNSLNGAYLQDRIAEYDACYQVYFNDYYDQLVEQYNRALANDSIPADVWADLKHRYPDFFDPDIVDYKSDLEALITEETLNHNKIIAELYSLDDEHRYAIFAGHYADSNPLFSVNWRGFMTARAGRIGADSPWWIHDHGLTQIKNSSIMFLGNPEAPRNLNQWIDLTFDGLIDNSDSYVLPANGSTVNGKKAVAEDSEYAQQYNITATNDNYYVIPLQFTDDTQSVVDFNQDYTSLGHGQYTDLGPEAFGEYGNFAFYAGEDGVIRFGVRLDGTVYADRLQVRNIHIKGGEVSNVDLFQYSAYNDSGDHVSYQVETDTDVIFSTQRTADTTVDFPMSITTGNKGIVRVLAGGSIHVRYGHLSIQRTAEGNTIPRVTIDDYDSENSKELNTTVTIMDGSGEQYFWKNASNLWVTTKTSVSTSSTQYTVDLANLVNEIQDKDAILLGGALSGWQMTPTKIFNKKTLNGTYVESIGLDAGNNQIRVANSQIVLDGTNGVLFIGRPYITSSNAQPVYTSSQIYMGAIGIQATNVGATQYTAEASTGSNTTYVPTYTDIHFGTTTYTYNEETDEIEETSTPYDPTTSGGYLQPIYQTSVAIPTRLAHVPNQNYYAIAYADDSQNQGINASTSAYTNNGIKLEFITELDNSLPSGVADYGLSVGSCIFAPLKDLSVLGAPSHRWNIFAHNVFIDNDRAATYTYVNNNDKILQDNIVAVNDRAAEALEAAAAAQNTANSGLANANKALKQIKGLTIKTITREGSHAGESHLSQTKWTVTRNNGETFEFETYWWPNTSHGHAITITAENGALKTSSGTPIMANASESTSAAIFSSTSATMSETNGTVSLSITVAGATATPSFDMANTNFYRKHAYAGFGIGTANVIGSTTAWDSTVTWSSSDRHLKTNYTIMSIDETVLASGTIEVVADKAYKAGWEAAITHAKATAQINAAVAELQGDVSVEQTGGAWRSKKNADGTYASAVYCYKGYDLTDNHKAVIKTAATINWSNVQTSPW